MNQWSFYNAETGLFIGRAFCSNDQGLLKANTPENCRAIEGNFDHLAQCISLDVLKQINAFDAQKDAEQIDALRAKLVIDYQPPQPSNDHEWNAQTKRWNLKPEIVAKQRDTANAQKEITALEQKQLRCMRELVLDVSNLEARNNLDSIDKQIVIQRALINANQ